MRIIRVFPRRTKATPVDDLVRIGTGPDLFDEADEVHVSVTFTWDLPLAEKLAKAWASHVLRAYVLCGWPKDTIESAAKRMQQTLDAGFLPMAMLYRDNSGRRDPVWQKWSRQWARPSIAASKSEKL
jgi:hypothetical protein